jgi:hypothetical protein
MAKDNDPKRERELDDFRRALTQQGGTKAHIAEQPSAWDRITAGLREAADHATGWAAATTRSGLGEAVSRFFGLPERHHPADRQPEPEPEKGIDR